MSTTKVKRQSVKIIIELEKNEAIIIKNLFGAMSDETIKCLLKGKNDQLTTAIGLAAEIYYDLDKMLDRDYED